MPGCTTHLLTKRMLAWACGLLAVAAALVAPLSNSVGAIASASAPKAPLHATYSALSATGPTGLPVVAPGSPAAATLGAKGPTFAATPASSNGPEAGSIRSLPVSTSTMSAWIATSASGGVCVLASPHQPVKPGIYGVGASCGTAATHDSGATLEFEPPSGNRVMIAGVVPDDVSAVVVTLTDGESRAIPVASDAWTLETDAHLESTHNVVGG